MKFETTLTHCVHRICKVVFLVLWIGCSWRPASSVGARTLHGPGILTSDDKDPVYNNTVPGCWLGEQFYMAGDRWSPHVEPQGLMPCVRCQCAQVVRRGEVQLVGRIICRNIKDECPELKCASPYFPPKSCCRICPGTESSYYDNSITDTSAGTGIPIRPSLSEYQPAIPDLTALLVGGGRVRKGERSVKTRAVAMIHVTPTESTTLKFALRFTRLKRPTILRFTDEYGTTLVEKRIPKQIYRTTVLYGEVTDVRKDYMDYIIANNAYVVITTARYRRGELSGRLKANTLAAAATYEAILVPDQSRGTGALVTLFYDTSSHMASFTVQIEGVKLSKLEQTDYYVTFEKSTEIKYQHMLHLSPMNHQMIGQIEVDSRMSKQIARGKIHVRVTSRKGRTMIGVLRPRLLRTGYVSLLHGPSAMSGHVILAMQEDGSLIYKRSLDGQQGVTTVLQRQVNGKDIWDDFFPLEDAVIGPESHDQLYQTYKRIRARDTVAVLNGQLRVKVTHADTMDYYYFHPYPDVISYLFQANSHALLPRSPSCPGAVQMFTAIQKDCTFNYYLAMQSTSYDPSDVFSMSLFSDVAGVVTKDKHVPWGEVNGLSSDLYQELGEIGIVVRIDVSDQECDTFLGEVKVPNHCWGNGPNVLWAKEHDTKINDPETDGVKIFRCYYDGSFYAHAQSWVPDDDMCVTCRCNRGNVHCDDVLCPSTTCRHPVRRSGECCAVCADDNDTERKHLGSCYYEGDKRWHAVGTYWHPYVPPFGYSKCAICHCMAENLDVNCTRLPCPELTCPDHLRVRINADDCCQVCKGGGKSIYNDVIDNNLIPQTKPQSDRDCTLGGINYEHGDKWHPIVYPFGEMKCYICSCKNGKAKCRKYKCPVLDCPDQYRPSGKCCPVCIDKWKNMAVPGGF